jgi:hypothetical protein
MAVLANNRMVCMLSRSDAARAIQGRAPRGGVPLPTTLMSIIADDGPFKTGGFLANEGWK